MDLLNCELLTKNIDRIAEYDFSNNKVFGSAYFVYQDGREIERCYGNRTLNSDVPVTDKTVFRLASMTKPITAVATLILVERGLLSLDDSVDKFLPEFKNIKIIDESGNSTTPKKIPTIKNILTHSSGIASTEQKMKAMTDIDQESLDSCISFYLKAGLDYEPETEWLYSGTSAFNVLTKIIEIITKCDYESFLKKEIFIPCNMEDTTFIPTKDQLNRMVEMHQKLDGKNAVYKMKDGCIFENYKSSCFLGGAGLVSTLHDYVNFAKMLLNKGETQNGRILKESTFLQLCTPQISTEIMAGDTQWGLGVRIITEDTHPYLPKGAFGWSGAYGTHFWVDPQNKIVSVFMKNSKFDGGGSNESGTNFEIAVYSSI